MRSLGESDPRRVGAYQLLAGLGEDETGAVLLGRAQDGRLVSVKVVSARLTSDDAFRRRFAQDVGTLRRVTGGFVAPVVDAGPAEGAPWVAAEFVPGVSLQQMLERGVLLGEDAVLRLAYGLVGALAEIHRVGLVHRDLTPVNVLLTDNSLRLHDFGVARAVDRDVSLVVGDAEFMSPEQVSGQAVTPASDVFSLGAVLHLAATGRSPFAADTRSDTLAQVVRARPALSGSLPSRLQQLLAACLAKDPGQRPSVDQVLAMVGPVPPGSWPSLALAVIGEQRAEIGRLVASAHDDAPTTLLAPVVVAAAPPPRPPRRRPPKEDEDERWRPDKWAIGSAAAVVIAIVFAIIMFDVLTPDEPLTEASQPSTTARPPTTSTTTTTTTTTTTPPVPYGEVTGLEEKCMDIAGARSDNGTAVQLYTCNGTEAQQWEFAEDGTVRSLDKCLDVAGGDTKDGTTVQIYDCNDTGAQQWTATPDGLIINGQSGKCLDVPQSSSADGTRLIIWTCHGEGNQRWTAPA